jgi:hypothetical protein
MTISNSLVAGLSLVLAGGCGLVRHFLLEPKVATYPQAPRWLLKVFVVPGRTIAAGRDRCRRRARADAADLQGLTAGECPAPAPAR